MQAGESQSSLWVSLGRMRAGQLARGLLEARTREDEQSTPDLGAQQQRTELDHSQEGVIPLHTGQQQHCTSPVLSHFKSLEFGIKCKKAQGGQETLNVMEI